MDRLAVHQEITCNYIYINKAIAVKITLQVNNYLQIGNTLEKQNMSELELIMVIKTKKV